MSRNDKTGIHFWRWHVEDNSIPVTLSYMLAYALRDELATVWRKKGQYKFPDNFHHHSDTASHGHAHYLCEDLDQDGYIDHVVLFVPSGIDQCVFELLPQIKCITADDTSIRITPSKMGHVCSDGNFGPSTDWLSVTPYITPWHRLNKSKKERASCTPQEQILKEARKRGLPELTEIEFSSHKYVGGLEGDYVLASQFLAHFGRRPPKPCAVGAFLKLRFSEPIYGSLSLGFGSHYGLGLLYPAHMQEIEFMEVS